MRKGFFAAVAAAAALAVVGTATAITDGAPDGNAHPYVGLMVALDANNVPLWRCSGTLMSSTVFLTAGHCTETPAAHAEIFFSAGPVATDPAYRAASTAAGHNVPCTGYTGYPCRGDVGGSPHTIPTYDPNAFFLHDAGVVVLDSSYTSSTYGTLPSPNQLDALKPSAKTTFTAVGYGLQKSFPDAAAWKDEAQRTRMVAEPHLLQINTGFTGPQSLLLSNNAHTGGTCFGDSGGPNFLGDSTTVAGVTSFGINSTCAGTGGVFRVDRPDVLAWLHTFGI